jgi:hypothetical protein
VNSADAAADTERRALILEEQQLVTEWSSGEMTRERRCIGRHAAARDPRSAGSAAPRRAVAAGEDVHTQARRQGARGRNGARLMGLHILGWTKANTARLSHLRKVRLGRGLEPMAPAVLDGYSASSSPSKGFLRFAELLGHYRTAEAFWHRVNEYCATHCAQTGMIHVAAERFGRVVLSRDLDPIGRAHGEVAYGALIDSGLAEEIPDLACAVTRTNAVTAQPRPRDGTNRVAVTAQRAVRDGTDASRCDGTTAAL